MQQQTCHDIEPVMVCTMVPKVRTHSGVGRIVHFALSHAGVSCHSKKPKTMDGSSSLIMATGNDFGLPQHAAMISHATCHNLRGKMATLNPGQARLSLAKEHLSVEPKMKLNTKLMMPVSPTSSCAPQVSQKVLSTQHILAV
eukprot:6196634-Amphidinium_carterae.1